LSLFPFAGKTEVNAGGKVQPGMNNTYVRMMSSDLDESIQANLEGEINLEDTQEVMKIDLFMRYSEANVHWKGINWHTPKGGMSLNTIPHSGYRTIFGWPVELGVEGVEYAPGVLGIVPNLPEYWDHYKGVGKGYEPAPDFLRFVQVVHAASLQEEFNAYVEDSMEGLITGPKGGGFFDDGGAQYLQNMSDYFYGRAGFRIEDHPVVKTDQVFYDYAFSCDHMVSDLENKLIFKGNAQGAGYHLTSDYNYYLAQYENLAANAGVSEIQLPDIYKYLGAAQTVRPKKFGKKENEKQKVDFEAGLIANIIISATNVDEITVQNDGFYNTILSPNDIEKMKDLNKYTYMFPMYSKLRIDIEEAGPITKILMDSNLEESFLRKVVEANLSAADPDQPGAENKPNFAKQTFSTMVNEPINVPETLNEELYGEQETEYFSYTTSAAYNIVSIDSWLANLGDLENGDFQSFGRYFVDGQKEGQHHEIDSMFDIDANPFLGKMAMMISKARISTILKNKQRSFGDILQGKLAYSETIMYRVSKFRVHENNNEPLKNYYFFNSPQSDVVEFVDTQVKYGASYRYVVYAYKVVAGNKYYYTAPSFTRPEGPCKTEGYYKASFHAVVSPSVIMVEIPIYGTQGLELQESTTYVFDEAPIYPNVNIIPYKNLGNKMLINISENVGRYIEEPIKIFDEDEERHNIMIQGQNVRRGRKIVFESEDPPSAYQIFRIDPNPETGIVKKPISYEDFKEHLKYSIELTPGDSANASFNETIQLNKKYYYTFRSVDVHDNISNPSPVYEVELVADETKSTVYPNIRIVNFAEKLNSTNSQAFKRYLHIKPALDQFVVGEEAHESALDTFPKIGIKEKALFEADTPEAQRRPNKFKIRMSSKTTGRKIDINIRFVHEHDFNIDREKDLRNNSS